ncbi:MAG: phenylalanine--tRNA ligase subunit beta [Candidatus Levybacteria bacterium]|nr:phenylalanine--tRNA ligase subunit beta [Candidatus Levybacteria bacterium]MBP9815496.1 phenylalanine--tRNA ligase subunit beta [Candidatus Levybacteria bacterium]
MNIKILDSWLREHLETKATPQQIGEMLSLTSVSVEKIEELGHDYLYDIEVTTNRPDLMSVAGIAQEAAVALTASGIPAKYIEKDKPKFKESTKTLDLQIVNNPSLVKRICGVLLCVNIEKSPQLIHDRLEATDIRSINNVVDVTNYVMRETGHPMHAFDFDKLNSTGKMIIREGIKGEKIQTLDRKEYVLHGGEIIATDGTEKIIDLLGVMGTLNTSVSENTKNVLLFVDNNDPAHIRRTSMTHGIRSDAAVLNEKGVDTELSLKALERGIELLTQVANATVESKIIDIYPAPIKIKPITISVAQIEKTIGVSISEKQIISILEGLAFTVSKLKDKLTVIAPSNRREDVTIPEDVVEEVARIYGYHKIPSILPPTTSVPPLNLSTNSFYWERRIKEAFKFWGFTEVYTYSLVSEDMLEVASTDAVKLANPLGLDMAFMRTTLIPSLLQAVRDNKSFETIHLFEMANVYHKKRSDLPSEILFLSGIIKKENISFFEVKGYLEALFKDIGIHKFEFKKTESGGAGADVYIWGNKIGEIEILERSIIDFEINFSELLKYVTLKKTYAPIPKFPQAQEDIRLTIDPSVTYDKVTEVIRKSSQLVTDISLLDTYQDKKTFRITYQSKDKSLTAQEITQIREKILDNLKKTCNAHVS